MPAIQVRPSQYRPLSRRMLQVRLSVRTLVLAVLAAATFCSAWATTSRWGVADVEKHVLAEVEVRLDPKDRLAYDPQVTSPVAPQKRGTWHFVGNGSSPFPFIVGVDACGMRRHGMGVG